MHYKDGTPATLGDIVQHDSGSVGIVIGGIIGNDYCSTSVVAFKPARTPDNHFSEPYSGFVGELRDEKGVTVSTAGVRVKRESSLCTKDCIKIGHVDIGHG